MRSEHKNRDVFSLPKKFAPIRVAVKDKHFMKAAGTLNFNRRAGLSPSQPHSKTCGR
jgi:hypothetical protein